MWLTKDGVHVATDGFAGKSQCPTPRRSPTSTTSTSRSGGRFYACPVCVKTHGIEDATWSKAPRSRARHRSTSSPMAAPSSSTTDPAMASRDEREARAHFEERYGIRGNHAAALLEERVIGAVWGSNGYTTRAQADELHSTSGPDAAGRRSTSRSGQVARSSVLICRWPH